MILATIFILLLFSVFPAVIQDIWLLLVWLTYFLKSWVVSVFGKSCVSVHVRTKYRSCHVCCVAKGRGAYTDDSRVNSGEWGGGWSMHWVRGANFKSAHQPSRGCAWCSGYLPSVGLFPGNCWCAGPVLCGHLRKAGWLEQQTSFTFILGMTDSKWLGRRTECICAMSLFFPKLWWSIVMRQILSLKKDSVKNPSLCSRNLQNIVLCSLKAILLVSLFIVL